MHKWKISITVMVGMVLVMCSRSIKTDCILPKDTDVQAGDIVFRRGRSWASRAVTTADREGVYSHTGIIVERDGQLMVVHAVPNEPDSDGNLDRVKCEAVESFFAAERASRGEVMRLLDTNGVHRATAEALRLYDIGVLFDHDYDMTDSTKLYCTELLVNAFCCAGIDITCGSTTWVGLPFYRGIYVLPSDVHQSRLLYSICKF